MAYVTVDVDMDDLDTSDMVEELQRRLDRSRTPDSEKKEILDLGNNTELWFEVKTLEDQLKIEHLQSVFKKYSISELQRLIPD